MILTTELEIDNVKLSRHSTYPGMLRPRGTCGLKAKSFGLSLSLGLTLSGLSLDLGLMTSGLGLIEIGLVASNIYSAHDIN